MGDLLERFRSKAEKYLKAGRVREILFSQGTYQIEVIDEETQTSFWPFFQFDEKGDLKDAFCSCEQAGENGACIHLASALLRIYNDHPEPFHVRFQKSLWNALCQRSAERFGYDTEILEEITPAHYHLQNEFDIKATTAETKARLIRLIRERPRETEETSLKFSNLSQEEIVRWKEGRPKPSLRYELSFWSDLAKWMTLLEDERVSYRIDFAFSADGFPKEISIQWPGLWISFSLIQSDLPFLIPALKYVHSPLFVDDRPQEKIKSIHYDPKTQSFFIEKEISEKQIPEDEGWMIGNWIYLPKKGFYLRREESPFYQNRIPKDKIPFVLNHYREELSKYITGVKIFSEPLNVYYSMAIDARGVWHFSAYLFKKGDLSSPSTAFFGDWAYLDGKGFYPLKGILFDTVEKTIPPEKVSEFINQQRLWLNTQEGFHTHLSGIESRLTYTISPEGILGFHSQLEEGMAVKDFGEWVYYPGEGFFFKKFGRLGIAVRPGVKVYPHEISRFIDLYREELEAIPRFFASHSPIKRRGLRIEVISPHAVQIVPEHELLPEYEGREARFFGNFIYLEGEGFSELLPAMRLPDRFENHVMIDKDLLPYFLHYELENLKHLVIALDPKLQKPAQLDLEILELKRLSEGGLKARLYYSSEIGRVSLSEIREALRKGERYLFSDAGLIDLEEERFYWLKRLKISPDKTGDLQFSTMEFLRLDAVESILNPPAIAPESEKTRSLLKEIRSFIAPSSPNLDGLLSDLRPYQRVGVDWLWFFYRNDLSALLCDEMGLGKTHQAMALIAAVLNEVKTGELRFLVVCPTSVIYHWQDKLSRYVKGLKVLSFHGIKRSLKALPKRGLLLTSYGILRSEKETLKQIPFEVAIFDEIQIAKNPHSRIHHALLSVQAKMRLGLTGTPIENNLRELKSVFDVVLPGYMPNEAVYRNFFINPIEKEHNEERKIYLGRIVKPFILRRKKREVLQELPEKSEEKSYCDLSEEQVILYNETLQRGAKPLLDELKEEKTPIPYVHLFAILSTLKQICDHPAIIAKDPKGYKNYASGKWDLFVELLEEARESNQKVVVFSQYLYMLDIIENYVRDRKWGYAQIRGDTIDRGEEMRRFQEDPDCVVFIGSLQAAGLGIDLTAASVVILYDRWWNAARENQAIDRVHRIGQKWAVQVFKLITKGTIEEKIDLMIEKKSRLMEEIITADDQAQLKKFSREELLEILAPLNT